MTPRISVCIPAYNRAVLLPPLLDSILAQQYPDYEIVVINDGSRDRTGEIAHGHRAQNDGCRTAT